jgi:hypothetical protein
MCGKFGNYTSILCPLCKEYMKVEIIFYESHAKNYLGKKEYMSKFGMLLSVSAYYVYTIEIICNCWKVLHNSYVSGCHSPLQVFEVWVS